MDEDDHDQWVLHTPRDNSGESTDKLSVDGTAARRESDDIDECVDVSERRKYSESERYDARGQGHVEAAQDELAEVKCDVTSAVTVG